MHRGAATEGSRSMRLNSACQTLTHALLGGLAAATVLTAAVPAHAGDLSNGAAGGIKDYGGHGVPVPVPQAYEENFKWYVRGDLGLTVKSSGKIDQGNWQLNLPQPDEWRNQSIISFGFGRYITPAIRVEGTLDYRPERKLAKSSAPQATPDTVQRALTTSESDVNSFHGTRVEDVTYQNTTLLMSAYRDFNHGGRLRPYVGAGVGIAIHQLQRSGTDTYTCYDSGSSVTIFGTPDKLINGCSTQNGLKTSYTNDSNATAIGYRLAAHFSTGVSYDITPRTHWETGYRAMWQGGNVAVTSTNGLSSVRLGDRLDHELRTGIRWDLW
jgi:opacity protein-like surface antigen